MVISKMLSEFMGFQKRAILEAEKITALPAEVNDYIKNVIGNIDTGHGLFLYGLPGTGKTCTMVCIAKKALRAMGGELDMFYVRAGDLMQMLYERNISDEVRDARLLFIDDLGVEYIDTKGFGLSLLDLFIDERYGNMKATIVATNLPLKTLIGRPGWERIVSRLRDKDSFTPVFFDTNFRAGETVEDFAARRGEELKQEER